MPARGDMEELVPLPTGDAGAAEWYLFWLSQLLLYGLGLFWSIPTAPAPVSLRGTDGLVTRQWRRSWLVPWHRASTARLSVTAGSPRRLHGFRRQQSG